MDHLNWTVREGLSLRNGTPGAFALDKVVTCVMGIPVPQFGPDVVHYQPPPFDVTSRFGLPAAAFINFPLNVA